MAGREGLFCARQDAFVAEAEFYRRFFREAWALADRRYHARTDGPC